MSKMFVLPIFPYRIDVKKIDRNDLIAYVRSHPNFFEVFFKEPLDILDVVHECVHIKNKILEDLEEDEIEAYLMEYLVKRIMEESLEDVVYTFVDAIATKHSVSSYEEFTCNLVRDMAEKINYFSNSNPSTII